MASHWAGSNTSMPEAARAASHDLAVRQTERLAVGHQTFGGVIVHYGRFPIPVAIAIAVAIGAVSIGPPVLAT